MINPIVAAIEIGSSKISGMVGRKENDDVFHIYSYASTPSHDAVRYGTVYNTTKTADSLVKVLDGMEQKMGDGGKIYSVYVNFAGRSLKTMECTVSRKFMAQTVIDQNLLAELADQAAQSVPKGYVMLGNDVQDYRINGSQARNDSPIGVCCGSIDCRYQLIIAKKEHVDILNQCFEEASIEIEEKNIMPVSIANAILTPDEMEKGCALIDYGSDTTTVAVFKYSKLSYLRVLPIGADLITQDVMNHFHITYSQAEELKINYGLYNVSHKERGGDIEFACLSDDAGETKEIPLVELGNVIAARNEEIIINALAQIKKSGYEDLLYAGIVMTGGGSNLRKLQDLISQQFTKIYKFRIVKMVPVEQIWDLDRWKKDDSTQIGLLSLLMKSDNHNCADFTASLDNISPAPVKQAPIDSGKGTATTLDMFDNIDQNAEMNSRQEQIDKIEEQTGENTQKPKKKGFWEKVINPFGKVEEVFDQMMDDDNSTK
ncbi:MAG: cell division protein FtsA [Bacteroidaceae bacterium]|nr:cell division protein FtsA [Bacteroidaceae bacterium]